MLKFGFKFHKIWIGNSGIIHKWSIKLTNILLIRFEWI